MEQIENYITVGSFIIVLLFWAVVGIKYLRSWKQLQKAMIESGMEWPLHSQEELNETFRRDLAQGHKIGWANMGQSAKILFTMHTDNPVIQKPLRSMRRALIAFVLFPFLFGFVLLVVLEI